MGGVGRWVSAHAGAMTAIAVLIAFVTASSVARCCAIHAPAEEEKLSPETIADEGLSTEAKALRKSYSDTTLEALGILTANVWVDGQGTSVATFTGQSICVHSRGDEAWTAYVVMASSRKALTTDGGTSTVTTLCMETPEWTEIATLTVPSAAADGGYATFQCPGLCGGNELALSSALKELTLDGPSDDYLKARNTSHAEAEAALAQWCALWRPTATTASWSGVVEEDHERREVRIFYELDDRRGSSVTLVVGMDDNELSVEEGGQ